MLNKRDLIKNKKGLSDQIILIMVMSIVLIFIILLFYVGHLLLPVIVPTLQDAKTSVKQAVQETGDQNLITAEASSVEPVADSLNNLEWMSYVMLIFSFLTFLVMCFYVRTYPFLMVVWILMIIVLIFVSIQLTISYQELRTDPILSSYYQAWENTDFVLQNLPIIILVMGIGGGIIMFSVSSRDPEVEIGGSQI